MRQETDSALQQHLSLPQYSAVQDWWDGFLDDEALQQGPRCLVHGDLWWDNLLVDEDGENLLGVIDFGDVSIVDPAYDFVPLAQAGPAFSEACAEAYQRLGGDLDAGFEYRRGLWRELRSGSFYSLRSAIREDDRGEIRDSLQKLRNSRILRHPASRSGKM